MRYLSIAGIVIVVSVAATLGQTRTPAQPRTPAAQKTWTARTPDGEPDLQGFRTNITLTPLQRPANLAGKAFFTPAKAEAYENQIVEQNNADRHEGNYAMTNVLSGARAEEKDASTRGNATASPAGARGGRQ